MRFTRRLAAGIAVAPESAAVQGKKMATQSLTRIQRYGHFDKIPHRKMYLGPNKLGATQARILILSANYIFKFFEHKNISIKIFAVGFAWAMFRVYCGVTDEYINCNYCYSGSSYNMGKNELGNVQTK